MKTLLVLTAIVAFAADPTWELELTTGEVLRGVLVERTDEAVTFDHPVLGRLTIPAASVQALREPAAGPPAAPAPAVVEKAEPPILDDAIDVQPIKKVKGTWKTNINLGINGSTGKTDESSFRIGLNSVYQDPRMRVNIDSFYLYKQTDNISTENKFTLGTRADWPFEGSRWGYFGQGRYDFDQFQSWRHRLTGGGGFTFTLVDIDSIDPDEDNPRLDEFLLIANGGIGLNQEFGSLDEALEWEGIIGLDFAWNISRRQRLTVDATIFPGITAGDYRFLSRGNWSLRLDNLSGITLNAGYFYEYQSDPDPGVSPDDLQFFIALGVDF